MSIDMNIAIYNYVRFDPNEVEYALRENVRDLKKIVRGYRYV